LKGIINCFFESAAVVSATAALFSFNPQIPQKLSAGSISLFEQRGQVLST
jgi:hypothetical protein